jgi:tetratricopeptide (TPR) repeat protein
MMQGSPRIDELRQKFHENPRRYFAPLANEYRKAGDPEQAIAICRAHLAQQPGHMSGHVVYAQSLYDAGRVDESHVVFEKALSLDPDNAIVLRYLGDISRQRGDSSEALHWYSRALEADPHDTQVAAYIAELSEPPTEPAVAEPAQAEPEATVSAAKDEEKVEEPTAPLHVESEAAPAPVEPDTSADLEAELPEPAKEPEAVAAAQSPFVTRTMAELYASQGHLEAALDVYHQLAAANPDDAEIADRIKELSSSEAPAEETSRPDESSAEAPSETHAEEAPTRGGQIPTMEPVEFADFAPIETEPAAEPAASNEYAELTDLDPDLTFHSESEPEAETGPDTAESIGGHFTETEIGESREWNEGTWSDDLSLEDLEVTPYNFSPSDSAEEGEASSPADATGALPTSEAQTETQPEPEAVQESSPSNEEPAQSDEEPEAADDTEELEAEPEPEAEAIEQQPLAEQHASPDEAEALEFAEHSAAPVPLGVLNDAHEEIAPEELATLSQGEALAEEATYDEPHEEESLVAYAPQAPAEEELAHYEPQGPTIREFFATLGARRPPTNGAPESFTAHAAVPVVEPIDDLPLASDAFSNLFADSPVSEDDSKAAFALSGAIAAQPRAPEVSRPRATPQAAAPPVPPPVPSAQPASPAATQESEEDIRRFREWLDGLADA